jgi:mannose-6-phosphate isomerase-like protein (cupin superfamily)
MVVQVREETVYLQGLACRQHEPVLLIEHAPLENALGLIGATGISVADVLMPFHISWSLYIGATTPRAVSEVPHWHPEQTEAYVILDGKAQMLAKYRWQGEWVRREAQAGDMLVVQPEVCHWFQWQSPTGLALVFKAPQRAGIGPYPAGKTICKFCPHYKNGCVLPHGFDPQE